MSMRGWTQADVDAYLARQSENSLKTAPAASGGSGRSPVAGNGSDATGAILGAIQRKRKKQASGPNKTEERFNRDMLGGRGVYEGLTFRLPGGSRYTPDWIYVDGAGVVHAFEVKGAYRFHSQGRALTAFREARAAFPWVSFHWAVWDGGKWEEKYANEKNTKKENEE
jgi:hypothetical protein